MEQSTTWKGNRSSASLENSFLFMESDDKLPRLQQPATCAYPDPYQ